MAKAKGNKAEVKAETKVFSFLPLKEATNNLNYWRMLALKHGFAPLDCYLSPRSDTYGKVKDVWGKEIVKTYDFSLVKPKGESISCICFEVSGIERPRRTYDPAFDNISHIKTLQEKDHKYLILKPLADTYSAMKERTCTRINSVYEKNHGLIKADSSVTK